jgi:hypothetical protein
VAPAFLCVGSAGRGGNVKTRARRRSRRAAESAGRYVVTPDHECEQSEPDSNFDDGVARDHRQAVRGSRLVESNGVRLPNQVRR